MNSWVSDISHPTTPELPAAVLESNRRELIETLGRIVSYEKYYRSVYGHYTQFLNRTGFAIPSRLNLVYEIRVSEASSDRLLLTAFSETDGKLGDLVSVDQDYEIHCNFHVPLPRTEFLRVEAIKHLRALRDAPIGQVLLDEEGIYRGYFRYEVRRDTTEPTAFAVGVRPPVLGVQLDLASHRDAEDSEIQTAVLGWEGNGQDLRSVTEKTGQNATDVMNGLEQAYLAQRIFHGEFGRYAKNWSELSKVTSFRFDAQERAPEDPVPFGDSTIQVGEVLDAEKIEEAPHSLLDRRLSNTGSGSGQFQIEPLSSAEIDRQK